MLRLFYVVGGAPVGVFRGRIVVTPVAEIVVVVVDEVEDGVVVEVGANGLEAAVEELDVLEAEDGELGVGALDGDHQIVRDVLLAEVRESFDEFIRVFLQLVDVRKLVTHDVEEVFGDRVVEGDDVEELVHDARHAMHRLVLLGLDLLVREELVHVEVHVADAGVARVAEGAGLGRGDGGRFRVIESQQHHAEVTLSLDRLFKIVLVRNEHISIASRAVRHSGAEINHFRFLMTLHVKSDEPIGRLDQFSHLVEQVEFIELAETVLEQRVVPHDFDASGILCRLQRLLHVDLVHFRPGLIDERRLVFFRSRVRLVGALVHNWVGLGFDFWGAWLRRCQDLFRLVGLFIFWACFDFWLAVGSVSVVRRCLLLVAFDVDLDVFGVVDFIYGNGDWLDRNLFRK